MKPVLVFAATWKPFELPGGVAINLPEPQAPSNYKDPVKIREYIEDAKVKQRQSLSDIWALRDIDKLCVRYYRNGLSHSQDIGQDFDVFEATVSDPTFREDWDHFTKTLQFQDTLIIGVNIRDILRVLCKTVPAGASKIVAYQDIQDQRSVVDPLGMFLSGDAKTLGINGLIAALDLPVPQDYLPGEDITSDMFLAEWVALKYCLINKPSNPDKESM